MVDQRIPHNIGELIMVSDGSLATIDSRASWYDAGGNVIGATTYGEGGQWPTDLDGNDLSLELVNPPLPGRPIGVRAE